MRSMTFCELILQQLSNGIKIGKISPFFGGEGGVSNDSKVILTQIILQQILTHKNSCEA